MINVSVTAFGVTGVKADLLKAGKIPAEVRKEMVRAKAEVFEKTLIFHAATMLQGPYYAGGVATSPKTRNVRATATGATANVKFEGTQHGNRIAEIAFINEYGKKSQPARPFISKSIKDATSAATAAEDAVLDQWLKENNL